MGMFSFKVPLIGEGPFEEIGHSLSGSSHPSFLVWISSLARSLRISTTSVAV